MISTFVAIIIIINLVSYFMQPGMVFFPIREVLENPRQWGLEYEQVAITTQDKLQLSAWYIPSDKSEYVFVFFHGNAGNMSHRRETVENFHELGVSVLIFDYRGYGESEGKISETGLYLDAQAVWQYLTEIRKIDSNKIIIFGRSLGGAVAADLALKVDAAGLVLESTFSSIRDMANRVLPIISFALIKRYDFNTLNKIPNIGMPKLFMHSQDDALVPYALGKKLFLAANEPKWMFTMQGGHNDGFIIHRERYLIELKKFLAKLNSI